MGRRIERQYIGAGPAADIAAILDEEERAEREERRALSRSERDAALGRALVAFERSVDLLMTWTLVANGYHRHNGGGGWRRRGG